MLESLCILQLLLHCFVFFTVWDYKLLWPILIDQAKPCICLAHLTKSGSSWFSNHELHLQNWKKIVLAWVPQGIYWYTIIFVMIAFKNLMHLLTIIIYYKNCCQLGQHSSNHTLFTGSLVIMGFQYLSSCPHFWKLPVGLEPSEVLSWRLPGDGVLLYSSK
jgi:hypothetical protein